MVIKTYANNILVSNIDTKLEDKKSNEKLYCLEHDKINEMRIILDNDENKNININSIDKNPLVSDGAKSLIDSIHYIDDKKYGYLKITFLIKKE